MDLSVTVVTVGLPELDQVGIDEIAMTHTGPDVPIPVSIHCWIAWYVLSRNRYGALAPEILIRVVLSFPAFLSVRGHLRCDVSFIAYEGQSKC